MRNNLPIEEQQEYLGIPYFNWEGFTFITGVTPDMVKKDSKVEEDEAKELNDMLGKHYDEDYSCGTLSEKVGVLIEKINDLTNKTK